VGDEAFDALTLAALRARAGDASAAADFVRASRTDVWRLCSYLASPREADDLTQETYARAFASLHRFAARSSARTWLLSIARRACADHIRSKRPAIPVGDLNALAAARPEAGAEVSGTVELQMMLDALEPVFREAFVLTQVVGLTYPEAADVVGCPVGTIRSRVARARTALVEALTENSLTA
jgi:RNA polymerase sigma-70 factor (ECF subfamily)